MTRRDWARLAARIVTLALTALAIATIPGSVTRPIVFDRAPIPPPVTSKERTPVTVVVRSARDHTPLTGARVHALSIIGDRAYIAAAGTTLAGGELQLSLPDAATWFLVDGTATRERPRSVFSRETRSRSPSKLVPAHELGVLVKDDLGAPIEGADVEVGGGDPLPLGGQDGRNRPSGGRHGSRKALDRDGPRRRLRGRAAPSGA